MTACKSTRPALRERSLPCPHEPQGRRLFFVEVNPLRVHAHLYTPALQRAFRSYCRYLLFAAMLLATCVIVGYRGFTPSNDSLPWIFGNLVNLRDSMTGASEFKQMAMLFWNNLKVTLVSIGLGWIFGSIPFITLRISISGLLASSLLSAYASMELSYGPAPS